MSLAHTLFLRQDTLPLLRQDTLLFSNDRHNDGKYPAGGGGGGSEALCIQGNGDFPQTQHGKESWQPGIMNDKVHNAFFILVSGR